VFLLLKIIFHPENPENDEKGPRSMEAATLGLAWQGFLYGDGSKAINFRWEEHLFTVPTILR